MYLASLEKLFKSKGITIGDKIRVSSVQGILMPRSYESDILVIKLDNGYNIGIKSKDIELIKKEIKTSKKDQIETHRGDYAILGCGGTIASKVEYTTGAVYPAISPQELKAAFPSLQQLGSIHARQLFSLFSEDLTTYHWKKIGEAVAKEIKEGVKGVVLMHGTDTMHYTAAALSFMLQDLPVPVVLVGAQRSSDRPSSENEMNLLNSIYSCKQDFAEVAICMHANTNDEYCYLHRGTRVRKMHTSRRDAFSSIGSKPLAKVDYKNNIFEKLSELKQKSSSFKFDSKFNDKVAIVYSYPGISPSFISKLDDHDGVILMGTGMGHVPTNPFGDKHSVSILKELKNLIDSGIPVIMAPQTINGRLNMNVYTTGRLLKDIGVIGDNMDWTPEVAFVKLSWVLGHTKNMKKIKEMMETNLVGEITNRSVFV